MPTMTVSPAVSGSASRLNRAALQGWFAKPMPLHTAALFAVLRSVRGRELPVPDDHRVAAIISVGWHGGQSSHMREDRALDIGDTHKIAVNSPG